MILPLKFLFFGITLFTQSAEVEIESFEVPSSVRAIEAIDENSLWFSGSGGVFGYTYDGGSTWSIDSVKHEGIYPEFRSIAVTEKATHILSVGSPGLLFRTTNKGKSWELVYKEDHEDTFYDAMDFADSNYGMAVGDPVNGCISVIRTIDGGKSWNKIPCTALPDAIEGEGCFAASDTNIILRGNNVWIVTGGPVARVYKSPDRGNTWSVVNTPIVQGSQMTGIFSVDFYDDNTGIVFGGDWNDKAMNTKNKAITNDGGNTWELLANGKSPGYRSCVQFIPGKGGSAIVAVGIPGISISVNYGNSWKLVSEESFYTIRIPSGENFGWLGGMRRIAKMSW